MAVVARLPLPVCMPFNMGCRMGVIEKCLDNMDNPVFEYDDTMDKIHDIIVRVRNELREYKTQQLMGTNLALVQRLEVIMAAAFLKFRNNDMLGLDWCIKEMRKELGYCPSPFMNIPVKRFINPFR